MEINLDKPLIVLDIEATGDQINKDRIVEIEKEIKYEKGFLEGKGNWKK